MGTYEGMTLEEWADLLADPKVEIEVTRTTYSMAFKVINNSWKHDRLWWCQFSGKLYVPAMRKVDPWVKLEKWEWFE